MMHAYHPARMHAVDAVAHRGYVTGQGVGQHTHIRVPEAWHSSRSFRQTKAYRRQPHRFSSASASIQCHQRLRASREHTCGECACASSRSRARWHTCHMKKTPTAPRSSGCRRYCQTPEARVQASRWRPTRAHPDAMHSTERARRRAGQAARRRTVRRRTVQNLNGAKTPIALRVILQADGPNRSYLVSCSPPLL